MNLKRLAVLAIVAIAVILPGFAADKAKVTLTEMVSQGWTTEADEALAAQFTKETGIGIEWQVTPADQHHDLLKTKLNAGEAPDIFWIQSNKWAVKTEVDAEKNCIDFTNESWVKTMPPAKIESVSYKGKVYGQGYYIKGVSFPVLYNKSLFAQYNIAVPHSYADFKKACEALKQAKIVPIYEAVPAGWHHVLWIMQIGGRYAELQSGVVEKLNTNKIKMIDVKPFVTAVKQLQEVAKLGYFGSDYMANSIDDQDMVMATRKAGMTLAQSGEINKIKTDYPDCKDDFGVFVIPLVDNQTSQSDPNGPARFGYVKSKYQSEIRQYFAFLARKENLQYKLDNTSGWTAIDVADSVGIEQHYIPAEKELMATLPQSKTGVIWQAATSYTNDQWMDIGKDLSAMFIGKMTPEQVVQAIDERRAKIAKANGDPAWK
jgi:raffinose/stachyose/melibiose transport system substrate-binding protein